MGRAESRDRMISRDIAHPWGRSQEFRRAATPAIPLMFVRSNAALFYSLAAASLLEATAPRCADRASVVFTSDVDFCNWIQTVWAPRRIARMHQLRKYLALMWPEFDSAAACEQFLQAVSTPASLRPAPPALEALARCTAASQSALFYRCLAQWAEDVQLRALARGMADEDEIAFARFSANYKSVDRGERLGMWASWRSADACIREARDTYVKSAFDTLVLQWGPNAPFGTMAYAEFVRRIKSMVDRYGGLGWAERLVFRAWGSPPSTAPVRPGRRMIAGFRPVVARGDDMPTHASTWGQPASARD